MGRRSRDGRLETDDRTMDMIARALLDMFGAEAPKRAQEMIDQKLRAGDEKGAEFWVRTQAEITRVIEIDDPASVN